MTGPSAVALVHAIVLLASIALRAQDEAAALRSPGPAQPLPYSHKQHVALGLQCRFCHVNPDAGQVDDLSADAIVHGVPPGARGRPAGDSEAGGLRRVR